MSTFVSRTLLLYKIFDSFSALDDSLLHPVPQSLDSFVNTSVEFSCTGNVFYIQFSFVYFDQKIIRITLFKQLSYIMILVCLFKHKSINNNAIVLRSTVEEREFYDAG